MPKVIATLMDPSLLAEMILCVSGRKITMLTKEVWPRNSFSALPDFIPWILEDKGAGYASPQEVHSPTIALSPGYMDLTSLLEGLGTFVT